MNEIRKIVTDDNDDGSSHLLEDQEETPSTNSQFIPAIVINNNVSSSLAENHPDDYQSDNAAYGSSKPSTSCKKIIYCVHGKLPSRCCATFNNSLPLPSPEDSYSHCHRERDEAVDKSARRKLIFASIFCVLFMTLEAVGGFLSSSLAIATDAAHLLTDLVSFLISLFALWVAERPATRSMSFGWYRAEVIGALTSVVMIWIITGILVYLAIERIIYKNFEINSTIMLITSGIGVFVNVIMGVTLHDFSHGHSHNNNPNNSKSNGIINSAQNVEEGISNSNTSLDCSSELNTNNETSPRHVRNINVRAAFIHVIGDFFQSVGVLIAALVIYFKPDWGIVDPICTFLFSILVVITTFAIIRDALRVLMEGSPKNIDFQEVCNTFLSLPDVVKVHNLRIWALSLDKTALAAHLAIKPGVPPQVILQNATRLIHDKYNFFEMTLQIEEFQDDMEDCHQCQIPTT